MYVADVKTLIESTDLSLLPATQNENKFLINGVTFGEQPTSNIILNESVIQNLRKASSHIRVDASAIGSSGALGISGTISSKVIDSLVVVTTGNGYDINLSTAILSDLAISVLPSTVRVSKLISAERVNIDNNNLVTSVDNIYDVINYTIDDNTRDLDIALQDVGLSNTSVSLPRTTGNTEASLVTGDVVRVTFYYINTDDS